MSDESPPTKAEPYTVADVLALRRYSAAMVRVELERLAATVLALEEARRRLVALGMVS